MNCHDTLLEIFNVIDNPTTLQRCRCVCQRWNKIILKSQAYRKLFASLDHNLLEHLKSREWTHAFHCACKTGHLEIAQWLVETFKLTAEDVRSLNNYAFQLACCNGHLEVAQWLVETFGLTAEDIRSSTNLAFRWACYNGHLEIAQWLVETFNLTDKDIRSWNNCAFQWAHINKHSNVTNWLTITFGIRAEDL
jgi:hypothetical protein